MLLSPFSRLYGAGVSLRNRAFESGLLRATRVEVPVISVGNIVPGGVGKTPLVRFIAEYCAGKGKKVAIVSRGYRRQTSGVVEVSRGGGPLVGPGIGGDEAFQAASALPQTIVVVAEKRVDAAKRAVALGAQVVVADDGFQHRYLGRDLNILVMDASRDLTREALIPAGVLREPLSSVARADVLALSHLGTGEKPRWVNELPGSQGTPVVGFRFKAMPLRSVSGDMDATPTALQAGTFVAFSGIGNHPRFLETLRSAGYTVSADVAFGDHHEYTAADFRRIGDLIRRTGSERCVTTEKDIARIDRNDPAAAVFLKEQKVSYIPVSLEFTLGETLLLGKIDDCLNMQINMRKRR